MCVASRTCRSHLALHFTVLQSQVIQRVRDELLVPIGKAEKTVSSLKAKVAALELPALEASHPPPARVLLELARAQSNAKRSCEAVKGNVTESPAKKPRVS